MDLLKFAQELESATNTDSSNFTSQTSGSLTNSAGSPTDELLKVASQIAEAEDAVLKKQAELYGAAFCDGFVSRMMQYPGGEGILDVVSGGSLTKSAGEEMYKVAYDMAMEKIAEEAYGAGYESAISIINDLME